MSRLTDTRRRALGILIASPGLSAARFARQFWPASPAWTRRPRRHDGISGAIGGGLIMSAGAFLRRMQDDKLVWQDGSNYWRTTAKGVEAFGSGMKDTP